MKKRLLVILLCLIAALVLSGCELLGIKLPEEETKITSSSKSTTSTETTKETTETTSTTTTGTSVTESTAYTGETTQLLIYSIDKDGYLIPVTINVPKTYQVAAVSLQNMIRSDETIALMADSGLVPILPENTQIREIAIENGVATVDLSEEVLNYSSKLEEYNVFASLVYVMTGFSTVDSVRIYIDGKYPGTLKNGAVIDRPLSREDVMINSNKFLVDPVKLKYDIYFLRFIENREYLVPLSAEFTKMPLDAVPEKMVEIMLTDYEKFGLYTAVPENTKVTAASLDPEGLLEVELSSEITGYGGGSARETALVNQLLQTFGGIEGVKKIKLGIEDAEDILPEGTELDKPFGVEKYINMLEPEN